MKTQQQKSIAIAEYMDVEWHIAYGFVRYENGKPIEYDCDWNELIKVWAKVNKDVDDIYTKIRETKSIHAIGQTSHLIQTKKDQFNNYVEVNDVLAAFDIVAELVEFIKTNKSTSLA